MSVSPADVLKTLLRTEKGTAQSALRKYFFAVSLRSNKPEIKKAVEEIFQVKVQDVNTALFSGKPKRVGSRWGYKSRWKRAVVTLKEGFKIEVAT